MPDAIPIGPVVLPPYVLAGVIALIAAAIVLRLDRTGPRAARDAIRDRGSTAIMVAFLVWKLAPLASYGPEIVRDPIILLRIPGGLPGLIAGSVAACIVLAIGFVRQRAEAPAQLRVLASVSLVAGAVFVLSIAAIGAIAAPLTNTDDGRARSVRPVELLDGESIVLDEIDGPIVLGFWATWCGPCRAELPVKQRFYDDYRDSVTYVAVNMTPSEAGVAPVRRYVAENALPYPVALDRNGTVANAFGVIGTPTTVVIGRDGSIVDRWLGPTDYSRLARAVRSAER
jgi:thiol-disulfide isomerase/thioredoxin